MSSDQQFVDGLSNGKIVADKENLHGEAHATRTGEPRNRLAIVGQQDRGLRPPPTSGPSSGAAA